MMTRTYHAIPLTYFPNRYLVVTGYWRLSLPGDGRRDAIGNWLIFQLEGSRCCDSPTPSPLQHYPNSSPVPLSSGDSGIPTMIGGTDPSLTRINNKWVFRKRVDFPVE